MDKLQIAADLGKSTRKKQQFINVNEVFYIWDILVTKLDMLETIQIFENMIEDNDLKLIKSRVKDGITTGIADMEHLMKKYDLPFPVRPPAGTNPTTSLENIADRDIYQMLFEAIQSFFPILGTGFMNCINPEVRKGFKNHLLLTIELQEMLVEYGKIKGFLNQPPVYKP